MRPQSLDDIFLRRIYRGIRRDGNLRQPVVPSVKGMAEWTNPSKYTVKTY